MSFEKPLFSQGDKLKNYEIVAQIKPGTRNSIYKAFIPGNEKHYYALKVFPYQEQDDIEAYDNEVSILEFLASNSIIEHKEHFTFDILVSNPEENDEDSEEVKYTYMCTVMDFCEELDLLNYFYSFQTPGARSWKPLKIDIIRKILYKTLTILNDIHSKGVVHHDIKPENFLVKSYDQFELVLTDFEFATHLMQDENIQHSPCGTPKYMAPEILNEDPHNQKVDIWSLGVMIYFFAFGHYPCKIRDDDTRNPDTAVQIIKDKVNKYTKISYGHNQSAPFQSFKDLLKQMLVFDQEQRITAEDALKHEFLADYNDLENETKEVAADISSVTVEYEGTEKYEGKNIEGN